MLPGDRAHLRAGRWNGWLKLEVLVDYLDAQYTRCLDAPDEDDLQDDLDEFWRSRCQQTCRPLYELVRRPPSPAGRADVRSRRALRRGRRYSTTTRSLSRSRPRSGPPAGLTNSWVR